jgi:hypothetical protein
VIYFHHSVNMLDTAHSLTTTILIKFSTIAATLFNVEWNLKKLQGYQLAATQLLFDKEKDRVMIERDLLRELPFPKPDDREYLKCYTSQRVKCNSECLIGVYRYSCGLRDLAVLGMVNKSMSMIYRRRTFLKYLIIRNYKRLVKSVGLDPDILGVLLKSTSSLLAGSFVLQCVTGECFHNCPTMCDIDIFVPAQNIAVVVQYLYTVHYDAEHFKNYSDEFPRIHSRLRLTHRVTGHRVDLFILAEQLRRFCQCFDSFDFTFLMNYFDGTSFQIWFPNHIIKRTGFYNEVT